MASQNQNQRAGPDDQAIGITERLCGSDFSWSGTLRRRFTDFLVNEIQRDGTVLHLTKFEPVEVIHIKKNVPRDPAKEPAVAAPTSVESTETPLATPEAPKPEIVIPTVSDADRGILADLLGSEASEAFQSLYTSSFNPATPFGKRGPKATSPVVDDKAVRSKIHQEIRRIFSSALDTTTDANGAIVASVMPRRGGGRGRDNRNGRDVPNANNGDIGRRGDSNAGGRNHSRQLDCPGSGEYLHFNLYKMNRDTMEAAAQIAKQLNLKPQAIQYAGTKDRRAVTVQRCSVRRRKPHELDRLNSRLYDICIGDFSFSNEPVHLGMLAGNEFTIALKGCTFSGSTTTLSPTEQVTKLSTAVTAALNHMHSHGWLNYFGHQRFGTFAVGTHTVGQLILSGDMEAAVHALLSYDGDLASRMDSNDPPSERSQRDEALRSWCCRAFLRDNDATRALERLPRRYNAEGTIIRHLSQRPTDFMGALLRITRGLRTMYLHAYQSYVWNHAASKRWILYGSSVVAGDLVCDDKTPVVSTGEPQLDQDGEEILRGETTGDNDDDAFTSAHIVTDEEAATGTYTIFDVVLPTPGHSTLLPTNAVGDFYREFMVANGGIDPAGMARPQREFSLAGRYRPMITRFLGQPEGWVKACEDEMEQLAKTDLDVIKEAVAAKKTEAEKKESDGASEGEESKKRPRSQSDVDGASEETKKVRVGEDGQAVSSVAEVKEAKEKNSIAVVIKFQLAKSAYATVALRELMGAPTTV